MTFYPGTLCLTENVNFPTFLRAHNDGTWRWGNEGIMPGVNTPAIVLSNTKPDGAYFETRVLYVLMPSQFGWTGTRYVEEIKT